MVESAARQFDRWCQDAGHLPCPSLLDLWRETVYDGPLTESDQRELLLVLVLADLVRMRLVERRGDGYRLTPTGRRALSGDGLILLGGGDVPTDA